MRKLTALTLAMLMLLTALTGCHQHKWAASTCTEPMTCECGETQGEPNGHRYGDWVETVAPRYLECGVEEQVCGICGDKQTREVQNLKSRGLFDPEECINTIQDVIEETDIDSEIRISKEDLFYNYETEYVSGSIAFSYVEDGKENQNHNDEGLCNNVAVLTVFSYSSIDDLNTLTVLTHTLMCAVTAKALDENLDEDAFLLEFGNDMREVIDSEDLVERDYGVMTMRSSIVKIDSENIILMCAFRMN